VKKVSITQELSGLRKCSPFSKLMSFPLQLLLLLCMLLGGGNTAFAQVIWSDEFDTGTSLDSTVWSYDLGASGWGNNELQEYTRASQNVRIEDGNLVITVHEKTSGESGSSFTSARVRTEDKLTFKYGTIEARIKVPDLADGLWPAFWTLGNNFSQVGWPYCGELDVMEMGSSSAIAADVINRRVGSAAHWDNQGSWASFSRSLDAASDLNDGYHIFEMDWTPTRITTYIDGQQIWTFNINLDDCADCSEFHQPHFMIFNMAVGGNYTGLLNSSQITATMPAEMLVDYVRLSDNGFTELGGSALPETPVAGAEYSGSWYNSDQSGHGFSMEFGTANDGSPMAVIYWYTYDTLGNPIFLVGTGVPDGNRLEIDFNSPHGMIYGEFNPSDVNREDGGTALLEFSDPDNATFSYTPSAFSASAWGHTPIESLTLLKIFGIPHSNVK
jgi:beta-glucanase (GH16 family)